MQRFLALLPLATRLALAGLVVTLAVMLFAGSDPAGSLRSGVPRGSDYLSFWGGAVMLVEHEPAHLYDHRALWKREHAVAPTKLRFRNLYPPPIYQLYRPLARLSYPAGARLHLTLMLAAMLGAMALLVRTAPLPGERRVWLPLFMVAPVVWLNLTTGQLAGLWLGLLAGGVLLLRSGRPVLGGAVLGVLCVKPSVGAAVAGALVLSGQGRALLGFGLGGASVLGVSVALDGIIPWRVWLEMMMGDRPRSFFSVPERQLTLRGLLAGPLRGAPPRSGLLGWVSLAAMALGALGALWVAPRSWRLDPRDPRWPLRFGLLLSALLMALPHLVEYDQGLHGLALLGAIPLLGEARRPRLGATLLLAVAVSPVLHAVGKVLHLAFPALTLLAFWLWAQGEERRVSATDPRDARGGP